jgi:stalled ribosome rescue protein Dom34
MLPKRGVLCCAVLCAAEDMWHVYNLVREGDHVTATTFRKVSKDAGAGGESERIKLKLTVKVEGIEFDPDGECKRQTCRHCSCC